MLIRLSRSSSGLIEVMDGATADLGYDKGRTLLGRVEVQAFFRPQDEKPRIMIDRITIHCLPAQDGGEGSLLDEDAELPEETGCELPPPSLLEELTAQFLNCAEYACDASGNSAFSSATSSSSSYPRSALRKNSKWSASGASTAFGTASSGSSCFSYDNNGTDNNSDAYYCYDPSENAAQHRSSSSSVSFSQLEITEFPITLGIHPSAVSGPPIMLDQQPSSAEPRRVPLDEYEAQKQNNGDKKRSRRQLKLSNATRRRLLQDECGFSSQQVDQAWREALAIRRERQETLRRGLLLQTFDEVYESACRKLNRMVEFVGL